MVFIFEVLDNPELDSGLGMAIFLTPNQARLGSLNLPPIIALPQLPNIISEWAAIIPLFSHLASHRNDYLIAGEVALSARLSIDFFPKLGTLSGLSRLLTRGQDLFDQASLKGGSTQIIWDVLWGSEFPSANGSASAVIVNEARRYQDHNVIQMPETLSEMSEDRCSMTSKREDPLETSKSSPSSPTSPSTPSFSSPKLSQLRSPQSRRTQTLHVLRVSRKAPRQSSGYILTWNLSLPVQILWVLICIVGFVFLILCGAYGTAMVLACSVTSFIVAHNVDISRTPGYLENNETASTAFMLSAPHQNATEWQLFVGDRGVLDWLLNKTMVTIPCGRSSTRLAARWMQIAHWLQLTAMTFTAAEKGWDGVFMFGLWVLNAAFRQRSRWYGSARAWKDQEGVEVAVNSFEFTGRSALIGAVYKFSGTRVTSWMDTILVPHPRRESWLQALDGKLSENWDMDMHERAQVYLRTHLALKAVAVLKAHVPLDEV